MTTTEPHRTIEQVRETILAMPFAREFDIEIEKADRDSGVASMPLCDQATYNGDAFAAFGVGLIADMAAGAATLVMTPPEQMALTAGIDSRITSSTRGSRLSATAKLREQVGPRWIFDARVTAHRDDGTEHHCGDAVVTMQIV